MNTVQLRNFDLNLLVVFDAVFRERTLAAASVRLSLSQSAISHALGRLRRRVGDELFVREANGMRPTPKALELARPVQRALARIQAALAGEEFDPQRSTRRVHVEVAALEAPQRLGRDVRIAVRVPNFSCVPDILLRTELVASLPRRLAQRFASHYELVSMPSPFEASPVTVEAIWHRQCEADQGVTWLRSQIEAATESLR